MPTASRSLALEITGMSCGHCVAAVAQALGKLPGVAVERVEIGSARLALDPELSSPDSVMEAVRLAGYEVRAANGAPVAAEAPGGRSLPLA
jgi:copper chaperone